ncbi:hypothetical protein TNCV_3105461 [Trichonephila clavipes]|nr:hypothetical protein TNCV_3105461 [Trichonephila clavipes]
MVLGSNKGCHEKIPWTLGYRGHPVCLKAMAHVLKQLHSFLTDTPRYVSISTRTSRYNIAVVTHWTCLWTPGRHVISSTPCTTADLLCRGTDVR